MRDQGSGSQTRLNFLSLGLIAFKVVGCGSIHVAISTCIPIANREFVIVRDCLIANTCKYAWYESTRQVHVCQSIIFFSHIVLSPKATYHITSITNQWFQNLQCMWISYKYFLFTFTRKEASFSTTEQQGLLEGMVTMNLTMWSAMNTISTTTYNNTRYPILKVHQTFSRSYSQCRIFCAAIISQASD